MRHQKCFIMFLRLTKLKCVGVIKRKLWPTLRKALSGGEYFRNLKYIKRSILVSLRRKKRKRKRGKEERKFCGLSRFPRKVLETLVRLTCNSTAVLHVQVLHAFGEHEFADIT